MPAAPWGSPSPIPARPTPRLDAHSAQRHAEINALPARDEARRALGLDRPTLLTLARLVPVKGLREALLALLTFPFAPLTRYWIISGWARLMVPAAQVICGA